MITYSKWIQIPQEPPKMFYGCNQKLMHPFQTNSCVQVYSYSVSGQVWVGRHAAENLLLLWWCQRGSSFHHRRARTASGSSEWQEHDVHVTVSVWLWLQLGKFILFSFWRRGLLSVKQRGVPPPGCQTGRIRRMVSKAVAEETCYENTNCTNDPYLRNPETALQWQLYSWKTFFFLTF